MKSYKLAIENSSKNSICIFNAANLYLHQGFWEKAIEFYLRSIEIEDAFAPAHVNLGIVYNLGNLPLEAIESFDRALRIDPECQEATWNRNTQCLRLT